MRRIVVTEFVTLDGIMEDPGGSEGTEHGGWAFQFDRGPEGDRFKFDEIMAADAHLLGRATYQGFAEAWPSRTGEFADKMNAMDKYVVSTTLDESELPWSNSTLIKGNVADRVLELREKEGGDILVAGSARLVQTLLAHDLVDELRLMIYPVLLGTGKRLFADDGRALTLQLAEARPVGEGVLILVYRRTEKGGD